MSKQSELYLKRIDELLATNPRSDSYGPVIGKVYMGTLSIAASLYGSASPQVQAIEKRVADFAKHDPRTREQVLTIELHGMLKNFRDEIELGLITTLQVEASGEVLADFIAMSKKALDNNSKDVAAVLACAALEDTLKRYAQLNGLALDDKDMSEVINALKSQGLVKGARGKVLDSFVTVRNKTFHAQWDKIESTEVHSVVAFVQEFLVTSFATPISE